ncbi:MAG TPA: NAD(P)-binding domain-containing protein [Nitrososphaerales archaeon]|nr:NAD(P)-binding domain-containing protein [Nitrososphaerales archaeon]
MSVLGLIGGTGDLGYALGYHLSKKNLVLLGSRNLEKAKAAVAEIISEKKNPDSERNLEAAENSTVVQTCDVIILTVPHANALETILSLSQRFRDDQILVSAVAAVAKKGDDFISEIDASGKSFAQQIKEIVPDSVKVAAAFQTVPANMLYREREMQADVPVATDSIDVYNAVSKIVADIQGLRPLYLGSLQLSGEVERLTALLLNIGKRNGLKSPTLLFPSF